MVLAGAAARLDRELALAFRAVCSVAFKSDALAEHREIVGGGDDLAAVRGLVAESDNAASALIPHCGPQLCRYATLRVASIS